MLCPTPRVCLHFGGTSFSVTLRGHKQAIFCLYFPTLLPCTVLVLFRFPAVFGSLSRTRSYIFEYIPVVCVGFRYWYFVKSVLSVNLVSRSLRYSLVGRSGVDRRFGRAPLLDTIVNFAPTPDTPSDRLQLRWLRYTRHWTISDAHSMRDFLFPTCPFLSDSDAPWKSVALVLVRACAGLRSKGPTRTR